MKTCKSCGVEKSLEDFGRAGRHLRSECRECYQPKPRNLGNTSGYRVCKHCNQLKTWRIHSKDHRHTFIYADESGRKWKAAVCPECYSSKQMAYKQFIRGKPSKQESIRHCRKCAKQLPADKYFYHTNCAPFAFNYTQNGNEIYL